MQSNKITLGSGCALSFLVIMTNGFSVMPGSDTGRDVWIAHLIAGALACFCTVCIVAVCEKCPGMSFGETVEKLLGKVAGKAMNFFFALFSVVTCVFSLTVFSRFVQITALPRTPQIIVPLLIVALSAFALKSGFRAASGSARLLFWFVLFVLFVFVAFGIKWIDYTYLMPELSSMRDIAIGAGEVFLNRFGTVFALSTLYTRLPEGKTRGRAFLSTVALASLALSAIAAITVATLGTDTSRMDFYPVFTAMSVRGVGGFVQHTEIFACLAMTLCLFFKCAVCLMFADEQLAVIFRTGRKRGIALPLALISASLTHIIYRDISSLRGMVEWKTGAGIFVIMLLFFAAVLGIVSKCKRKMR